MKEWLSKNYKICLILLNCIIILFLISYLLLMKPTYEIIFDSNGGSTVMSVEVKKGDKIPEPEKPQKDGYIFMGWEYKDELYDFNKPVTKKITLKAVWNLEEEGITLEKTSYTLKPKDQETIKVYVNGELVDNSDLIFTSSDEEIAKVLENGNIEALKNGKVTITIKTKDNKYTASLEVIVASKITEVESVSISGSNKVMVGSILKLSVNIKPSNATNKNVTWQSSDETIATVDSEGNVKGISAGTVTISVTSENGKKASKKVTVINSENESSTPNNPTEEQNPNPPEEGGETTPSEPSKIPVEGVTLTGIDNVKVSSSITLTVNINPNNATNKNYTCTSSNPAIAKVDPDTCVVTGVNDGEAVISVTTADGNYTATHKVSVSSTYVVEFTAVRNNLNDIVKYNVVVYKNNVVWDGFSSIEYNGKTDKFKEPAIPGRIDTNVTEAKIKVNGQVIATAKVVYK